MKNMKPLILFLTFFVHNLYAQNLDGIKDSTENQFSISLQLRPRAEFRHGNFQPLPDGFKPSALISQRTRLALDYQFKDLLEVRVSPQMVSVWGQESMTQGVANGNSFSLYETWAKINFKETMSFKVGRQVISLDDERFFGELDWAQGGRVHDAVAFQYHNKKWDFRTYLAFNQNYKELYHNNLSNVSGSLYSPEGAILYKWMQTAWTQYRFDKENTLSAMIVNLGFQDAADRNDPAQTYYSQTLALNYFHTGAEWKYQAAVYYQAGKNQAGKKVNAYMATLNASKKIGEQWNLGLGGDLLSGNDVGKSNPHNHIFTPYFATGHKFYGSMDYYYAGNGHGGTGLADLYFKANYKPTDKVAVSLAAHQFLSPNQVFNPVEELTHNLGQELDLGFSYRINKFAGLMGGYSIYTASKTTKYIKGVSQSPVAQHWLWLSLNINPKIFNHKS